MLSQSSYKSRSLVIAELFQNQPKYRLKQLYQALYNPVYNSWKDVLTLPKELRQKLLEHSTWLSLRSDKVFSSADGLTFKVILKTHDEQYFESVLMKNKRGYYTVCLSSQIGCPLACTFCATGTMGLKRNLEQEEMVDQYRYWSIFLHKRNKAEKISNLVFMGMGEPLLNYENLKNTINELLEFTGVGPNHITVSTAGVLPVLKKVLKDKDWPSVRIAISFHL